MTQAILGPQTGTIGTNELTARIQSLTAAPKTNDPAWWNDLAGAHLRLGQADEAAKILEPLTNRFANDAGIHANLGTAYHQLGRYVDAEREIRRSTELDSTAHFGCDRFHLALLQYLCRDENYRLRHVYLDEFTLPFLVTPGANIHPLGKSDRDAYAVQLDPLQMRQLETDLKQFIGAAPLSELDSSHMESMYYLAMADEPPEYLRNWNLGTDPNLDNGIIAMAALYPKEPACWVMLGIAAEKHWDMNLARAAFQKAIELRSPQTPVLLRQLRFLNQSHTTFLGLPSKFTPALVLLAIAIAVYGFKKWQDARKRHGTLPD